MGILIDGEWHTDWYDTKSTGGRFVRSDAKFRCGLDAVESGDFRPEPGRYHLYVSYACPWAHRTLIVRALKKLEAQIDVSPVHFLMLDDGWTFTDEYPDHVNGKRFLREIYLAADPRFTGRVTVPVLWDKREETIVCNESAEIVRLFDRGFGGEGPSLYPDELASEIDEVNALVYPNVNNGVYRAGFATTQEAYEEAVVPLFETLDALEARLEGKRYLVGDRLTEADIRLFTTLLRFDPVYVTHFKCNKKRLVEYPNLYAFTRRIYQLPGVAETVRFDHIKGHYYRSHSTINPSGVVPVGFDVDLDAPVDAPGA
jgi:glutathionyl-hydroquinone reductase